MAAKYRVRGEHVGNQKKTFDKSMTQQHFKREVDIHTLIDRAQRTGVLGDPYQAIRGEPMFGDFSQNTSLHGVLEKLARAEELWMTIPSEERAKYSNDVRTFLKHVDDLAVEEREKQALLAKQREANNEQLNRKDEPK